MWMGVVDIKGGYTLTIAAVFCHPLPTAAQLVPQGVHLLKAVGRRGPSERGPEMDPGENPGRAWAWWVAAAFTFAFLGTSLRARETSPFSHPHFEMIQDTPEVIQFKWEEEGVFPTA